MIKLQRVSKFVQYENIADFALESFIIDIKGFHMKVSEIVSNKNIPLYVELQEEVINVYLLTTSSSEWVRENLEYSLNETVIILSKEFMFKFDLVRVIPANGLIPYDSFLRVMLKQSYENSKLISIEDEMSSDKWKFIDWFHEIYI